MLKLNLVYPERSDIKYNIVKFSDSQVQFTLDDPESLDREDVLIYSRMSWEDVQVIIAVKAALDEACINYSFLNVPYFLGARSDRKFSEGGSNYLKDVICPIINSLEFNEVVVLDPHSDVLEGCLEVYTKGSNVDLVKWAISEIYPHIHPMDQPYFIVSPDAGALKKIYDVAKAINYTNDIIVASKHRDIPTGKILSTDVPIYAAQRDSLKDFIIIDDICDGGRTFIEIAKIIEAKVPSARIYLIVTHGIFSQGFYELNDYFTDIFCTNSVWDNDTVKYAFGQGPRLPKQLNVFQ